MSANYPASFSSLSDFLKQTGWETDTSSPGLGIAYTFFNLNVPLTELLEADCDPGPWSLKTNGAVVRLTQWMQAIDFAGPVHSEYLPAGTRLWSYHSPTQTRPGNWFTLPGMPASAMAIDRTKTEPHAYVAIHPFPALISRVSDAYVDWARQYGVREQYRDGGGTQIFVWKPEQYLRPDPFVAWTYQQSTGNLSFDGQLVGSGYSGAGTSLAAGRNNPDLENVPNIGPIPRGLWLIGPSFSHPTKGPVCMNLSPVGHNALGRSGFMIHGNNTTNDASEGCIILGPGLREQIANSIDRLLRVVR